MTDLRTRLPRFYVPLDQEDEPVTIDLQLLVAECYEDGLFGRQIDYTVTPPAPAFPLADREWIEETLKARRSQ